MKDTFTFNLEESMDNLYKGGAFLTASKDGKVNTMTISWGSVGYMFRKPVFMALVRDSRYTNEFLKDGEEFTISIPKEDDNLK
ncbi:MAG: flavin reductase family protein, partial [Clostridium sp.]